MTADRRTPWMVTLALPALALALVGLFHPHSLTAATAQRWTQLHIAGLFVFPLVGAALAVLVRGRRDPVAWLVRLSAYVFATAYSALDVISGIGAGYVTWQLGEGVPRPVALGHLFTIGSSLGHVGSWALIACTVLIALDAVRRLRLIALPALLLVPGAVLVHIGHIFAPVGVTGMLLIAVASGWLGWVAGASAAPVDEVIS